MNNKNTLTRSVPLYQQIKDILKNRIESGEIATHENIPSLQELSETFGVSMITARQAVGKLIEEGMLYVVHGKGTFVAEQPAKRINIGVAVDHDMNELLGDASLTRDSLFHLREWMDYLSTEGTKNNCIPLYMPTFYDTEQLHRFAQDNSIEGVVILGSQRTTKMLELTEQEHVPHVVIGDFDASESEEGTNYVVYDHYAGACKAAGHVLDNGYREIGIFIGTMGYFGYQERLRGYRDTLERNGIDLESITEKHCNSGAEGGYKAMKELLNAGNRPSALLCCSDFKAVGAIRAAKEEGLRIPQDLAVMGFDGLKALSGEELQLTTVRIPKEEMVREALDFLLGRATANGNGACRKKLEPDIITGGTVPEKAGLH